MHTITQNFLKGRQYYLNSIDNIRQDFNSCLDRKKFDIVETKLLVFEEEYHIAVASSFTMDFDIHGNIINNYQSLDYSSKLFYLTIFPQEGKTYVLFSYLRDESPYLSYVIDDICKLDKLEQRIILSNIIAIQVENFALSPVLWDQILEAEKKDFISLFGATMAAPMHNLKSRQNINLFKKI